MKILLIILGFLNGAYMLLDGVYVMLKGKYIGPEKPGPWAGLFYKLNIDVFKLGPLFIVYGVLWLTWLYGFWLAAGWAYVMGLVLCLATLWYLPAGTLFSVVILICLLVTRHKTG